MDVSQPIVSVKFQFVSRGLIMRLANSYFLDLSGFKYKKHIDAKLIKNAFRKKENYDWNAGGVNPGGGLGEY